MDNVPTMGEEAEKQLQSEIPFWRCYCGQPSLPGVLHRQDAPCYMVENPLEPKRS